MDGVLERAAQWGIETEHYDGLGRHWTVEPAVLARVLEAIGANDGTPGPQAPQAVNHHPAYQGNDSLGRRSWAIAVQLYGIRSRHNWGHGDFSDLADLIEMAGAVGASAIGLNPLHALFDDRPNEASPYLSEQPALPQSALYRRRIHSRIPTSGAADIRERSSKRCGPELVDYASVARIKMAALALAHENFRRDGTDERRQQFAAFRQERGPARSLRRIRGAAPAFRRPWWQWPREWRKPDAERARGSRGHDAEQLAYVEFLQWIAHQQLAACRDKAARRTADRAISRHGGRRPAGRVRCLERSGLHPSELEIGAPPDPLNTPGAALGTGGRQSRSS